MICEKCGGKVNTNMKCTACGFDNSATDYNATTSARMPSLRSARLTIFMTIIIIFDALIAFVGLYKLLTEDINTGRIIILAFTLFLSAAEIIICFFVLKMKKWALLSYIGLSAFGAVIQLLSLDFLAIIFKALLLYFIFKNDWEYFE